ncbi:MAG: CYTH and CHAD domain-containing protein [Rhodospirillaceae bacterium]
MATESASRHAAGVTGREIELKLHAEPQFLARLADHPALRAVAGEAAVVRRQTTTYYDTPDHRLAARGVALRVRVEDDGRITQAVKTLNCMAAGDTAAVSIRREWQWPLLEDDPDLALLRGDGVDQLVPPELLPALKPLFATEIRRTVLVVRPDALTTIEIAFDVGVVRAGARQLPISEIELELRCGKVGHLFDLALELQNIVPLRIAGESKAEAGYRLVTGRPPAPFQSEPAALSPATSVAEAFRHIVRHCLRQLLHNEDCALLALAEKPGGADLTSVRNMRHALRRLRHAVTLFGPAISAPAAAGAASFADQCRTLGRRLAPASNWSIVAPVLRLAGLELPPGAPVPGLDSEAAAEAGAVARVAILAPEFTALVLSCGGWLEQERWCAEAGAEQRRLLGQPIADAVSPWLEEVYKKARKAGIDKGGAEELKRLRRRLRRLFDAADGFRGLFAPALARPFMAALTELRGVLDDVDDLAQTRDLLRSPGIRADATRAALLERRIAAGMALLPDAWKRFRQAEPFWKRG